MSDIAGELDGLSKVLLDVSADGDNARFQPEVGADAAAVLAKGAAEIRRLHQEVGKQRDIGLERMRKLAKSEAERDRLLRFRYGVEDVLDGLSKHDDTTRPLLAQLLAALDSVEG